VETVSKSGGAGLRVRGLEFAGLSGKDQLFGVGERVPARDHHLAELHSIAAQLRSPATADHEHPLYSRFPKPGSNRRSGSNSTSWIRRCSKSPVYGQVPAFAGGERGVLDVLAFDRAGRLSVLELKASADLQLPAQALNYWIHLKWHLDRGEFNLRARGYLPGTTLGHDPPRLLTVSPRWSFTRPQKRFCDITHP
jgi:hypothetical protein